MNCLNSEREYYAIIADEVTDRHANVEIILVCLRYLDFINNKFVIKETFPLKKHGIAVHKPMMARVP